MNNRVSRVQSILFWTNEFNSLCACFDTLILLSRAVAKITGIKYLHALKVFKWRVHTSRTIKL